MSGPQWLDQIERELVRRRLPRHEVARLLAELSDHLDDVLCWEHRAGVGPAAGERGDLSPSVLMEEPMSMSAHVAESLGSPAEIAESAVREFQRRNLLNRSRLAAFATFVLAPVPLVIATWAIVLCLLMLIGSLIPDEVLAAEKPHTVTAIEVIGVNAFVLALVITPPIVVAAFYGRLARRTAHGWRWGVAACLLVGIASGLANYNCTFSEEPRKSQIMCGVNVGMKIGFPEIAQFAIPLVCGLIVLRRSVKSSRPSEPLT